VPAPGVFAHSRGHFTELAECDAAGIRQSIRFAYAAANPITAAYDGPLGATDGVSSGLAACANPSRLHMVAV
jgi:hypothetical protein